MCRYLHHLHHIHPPATKIEYRRTLLARQTLTMLQILLHLTREKVISICLFNIKGAQTDLGLYLWYTHLTRMLSVSLCLLLLHRRDTQRAGLFLKTDLSIRVCLTMSHRITDPDCLSMIRV